MQHWLWVSSPTRSQQSCPVPGVRLWWPQLCLSPGHYPPRMETTVTPALVWCTTLPGRGFLLCSTYTLWGCCLWLLPHVASAASQKAVASSHLQTQTTARCLPSVPDYPDTATPHLIAACINGKVIPLFLQPSKQFALFPAQVHC